MKNEIFFVIIEKKKKGYHQIASSRILESEEL